MSKWLVCSILCVFYSVVSIASEPLPGVVIDTIHETYALINDSTFLFDYKPGDSNLYAIVKNNKGETARISEFLKKHLSAIKSGEKVILVKSYAYSEESEKRNLELAYWLSYRSKSWLIWNDGMKEEYFRTKNYSVDAVFDDYNKTLMVVVDVLQEQTPVPAIVQDIVQVEPMVQDTVQPIVQDIVQVEPVFQDSVQPMVQDKPVKPLFAVKTNTLYWAVLAPNAEIEWFVPCASNRWSLSAEGVVAWWRKKSKEKTYQIQQYSIEGRFWFDKSAEYKKHFIALYANAGLYDLGRDIDNGNRGEFCGAGLSYGYALPLKGRFRMEFQFGVGYIKSWFDRYHPHDGHHVWSESKEAHYFGPTKTKVSVGWIFNKQGK